MTQEGTRRARPTGFRRLTQYALPALGSAGGVFTSLKLPQYSVLVGLFAQIFFFYTGWRLWRNNKEGGLLACTCISIVILGGGVTNYWIIGDGH